MPKYLYEVYLKNLVVADNGANFEKIPSNFISANLIYPKEGVPSIESIKETALKDGKKEKFDAFQLPEKLFFKSTIQGTSFIEFNVTAKTKTLKITKIAKEAIKLGIVAGLETVTGGFINLFLVGAAKSVTTSIFDLVKQKDKVKSIGKGCFELTNATLDGNYKVKLVVPKTFKVKRKVPTDPHPVDFPIKKGMANGELTITIRRIPLDPIA